MPSFKTPSFQDRIVSAAQAREKAVQKLKSRPPVDAALLAEQRAAREAREQAKAKERSAAVAARAAAKAEAAAHTAAELAAAEVAAAEKAARLKPATAAEMKAARDARYTARKMRINSAR